MTNNTPFRVLLAGDAKVGKTAFLNRLIDSTFDDRGSPTSTTSDIREFHTFNDSQEPVLIEFHDSSEQPGIYIPVRLQLQGKHGVMIIFDVTKESSFREAQQALARMEKFATPTLQTAILIGNKSDLHVRREVDFLTAKQFADDLGICYFEASAKEGTNIAEVVRELASSLTHIPTPDSEKHIPTPDSENSFLLEMHENLQQLEANRSVCLIL